ncbi:DUF6221 family protein [Streptomyces sp. NPDC058290]|uniref:DUF6221 family protein n=1 Tax=Streptomyces sp. NPDC058290 TaxID=3346426 RepID=UPI0036EAE591
MDALLQFLRDRFNEDARVARAAELVSPSPWRAAVGGRRPAERVRPAGAPDGHSGMVFDGTDEPLWDCEGSDTLCMDGEPAEHAACHDPARVLAEVDAKRRLLTVHARDTTYSFSGCVTCDAGDNSCGCMGGSPYDYPCETLRLLALPYADHPDYRPEWAPDPA